MKTFRKPWKRWPAQLSGPLLPLIEVSVRGTTGRLMQWSFLVDSGAELSMGSRALCEKLGLDWRTGSFVEMRGISSRPECVVAGMIHPVEILVREAGCR